MNETMDTKAERQEEVRKEKDSFLYYASNLKVVESFPEELRGKVNMAIIEYGAGQDVRHPVINVDGTSVNLNVFLRHIFENIDVEKRRYKNREKVNKCQNLLLNAYDKNLSGFTEKELNQSLKKLRKLIIDINKHDIKDIDNRIIDFLPDSYIKGPGKTLPLSLAWFQVADYLQKGVQDSYISEEEFEKVKEALQKVYDGKQSKLDRYRVRRVVNDEK